ncbi:MAG: hypothetical protein V2J55_05330 [Candidatus Competibacteraceae bacterium]|nr:hypothetical protein [Candidatus Competibacteraceae bacterium]
MNVLRELVAIIVFIAALYLLYGIISTGFSWVHVAGAVVCFTVAYFVWPSKRRGQRQTDHWLLDVIEIVVEFPIELILWLARGIGNLFDFSP